MPRPTLVTGFAPFGGHVINPSAVLAQACGRSFDVLEVSFAAVDAFLGQLESHPGAQLLMLGLRARGSTIDLELVARNHVGPEPDVRGEVRGPAPIDPTGPDTLASTLFTGEAPAAHHSPSHDAGCYLCNYIYYQALRRLPPNVRIGFVHVPPFDALPFEEQRLQLLRLIAAFESGR